MIDPREPQPELTTARVRGGRSPWLVAIVALAVLGGVVYVGVSGHSAAPTATSSPQPALAAQPQGTAVTVQAPVAPEIERPYAGPVDVGSNPSALRPQKYLGAKLDIGQFSALAQFTSTDADHLHAAYSVPLPAPVDSAELTIVDVIDQHPSLATYGTWSIPLDVFHGGVNQDSVIGAFGPTVMLQRVRPPDPTVALGGPDIERNGFSIEVTAQQKDDAELVAIDVALGPGPQFPDETYRLVASAGRKQFVGRIRDSRPGHIRGEIFLPKSFQGDSIVLTLAAVTRSGGHTATATVSTSSVTLPDRSQYPNGVSTSDLSQPAAGRKTGFPGIEQVGYQLHVVASFDGPGRGLFFDLQVNPTLEQPATSGQG